jgi:putative addiction module component (TIGR02574 family)
MTTRKCQQISPGAWMRERTFYGMSSFMLLERFPEVQSLGPEDKWRLIDELWSDLAQQVEGEAPNENIVELLEKRFSDYLVDPSQGQPADDAFARLAEHKRQWK